MTQYGTVYILYTRGTFNTTNSVYLHA